MIKTFNFAAGFFFFGWGCQFPFLFTFLGGKDEPGFTYRDFKFLISILYDIYKYMTVDINIYSDTCYFRS